MNFLNDATLQPRSMRLRAPTHELSLTLAALQPRLKPALEAACAPADDDFSRCGWFDSSLELAAGLKVIEHLDSLPEGLPLQTVQ